MAHLMPSLSGSDGPGWTRPGTAVAATSFAALGARPDSFPRRGPMASGAKLFVREAGEQLTAEAHYETHPHNGPS